MNDFSKRLKDTFQEISKSVFEFIEVVNPEIRQVNEDGISSIILKKIFKLKNYGIFVKTKSLDVCESKTGVDFDLWIGENDNRYIRLIIQAKSFGNKTNPSNSYDIRDSVQCNKIIAHSKREHESFPIYFLYQHIKDDKLKANYFSFLDDFEYEYSSVTVASAFSIKAHIESKELSFSNIHQNRLDNRWKNVIYELFEQEDKNIGLPFYLLYDISPSKIERFQKLINNKNNSFGFFFYFFFGEKFPFKVHNITAEKIEQLYGENSADAEIQFKNLIIINDSNKLMRDRAKELEILLENQE